LWRRLPACAGELGNSPYGEQPAPRASLLAGLILTVVSSGTAGAAVEAQKDGEHLTVHSPVFQALFEQPTGGLLKSLKTASGQELIRDSTVYTDRQLLRPREYFGSRHAQQPSLDVKRTEGKTTVTARGRLLNAAGAEPEGMPFRYEIRYTFDASSRLSVDVKIVPDFDEPELRGFLAHTLFLAPQREFFANTTDGRICELAATTSQRTWQSVREPLSATAPWLGVVLKSGSVLKFTVTTESAPLQNVFFHDSGNGPTTLFFAWLDGGATRPVRKGDEWVLAYTVEAVPLGEFRE